MKTFVSFIRAEKELVMVVLASLLIVLLIIQNLDLKRTNARLGSQIEVVKTEYALQYDFTTAAARMIGNEIPADLSITPIVSEIGSFERVNHLLMVYNPTVCGISIIDQLNILKDIDPRLKQTGLQLKSLIGVSSQSDKNYTLSLQRDGLVFYPFTYVETDLLSKVFPLQLGTIFLDTPLYFITDSEGRIEAAFKPDGRNPDTLKHWLESIYQARKKRFTEEI